MHGSDFQDYGTHIIFDNVFDRISFNLIRTFVELQNYKRVTRHKRTNVWAREEVKALSAQSYFFLKNNLSESIYLKDTYSRLVYPTSLPIDFIFETLLLVSSFTERYPSWIEDWDFISARSYLYPRGAGISWHTDSGYSAAFIYYSHSVWKKDWGGELLISNDKSARTGFFVQPTPNRLVIIKKGYIHKISTLATPKSKLFRSSISGFFTKYP